MDKIFDPIFNKSKAKAFREDTFLVNKILFNEATANNSFHFCGLYINPTS